MGHTGSVFVVLGLLAMIRGLQSVGSVSGALGPCCPVACGILVPRPGTGPESPAVGGGFLTSAPPGRSPGAVFFYSLNWF